MHSPGLGFGLFSPLAGLAQVQQPLAQCSAARWWSQPARRRPAQPGDPACWSGAPGGRPGCRRPLPRGSAVPTPSRGAAATAPAPAPPPAAPPRHPGRRAAARQGSGQVSRCLRPFLRRRVVSLESAVLGTGQEPGKIG